MKIIKIFTIAAFSLLTLQTSCSNKTAADFPNSKLYHNNEIGFSIQYPEGWTIDPDYIINSYFVHDTKIKGISFIAKNLTKDTNANLVLVSVEKLPLGNECNEKAFLFSSLGITEGEMPVKKIINGINYEVISAKDAAMSHNAVHTVSFIRNNSSCFGISLFIDSTVKEAMDGKLKNFDEKEINSLYEKMLGTFKIDSAQ